MKTIEEEGILKEVRKQDSKRIDNEIAREGEIKAVRVALKILKERKKDIIELGEDFERSYNEAFGKLFALLEKLLFD